MLYGIKKGEEKMKTLILILIIGLAGCGHDDGGGAVPSKKDSWVSHQSSLNNFTSSCSQSKSAAFCGCMVDAITSKWTFEEFQTIPSSSAMINALLDDGSISRCNSL